jgi:hypothetical protein
MYDYLLRGKDHYPIDRDTADVLLSRIPELRSMALANRAWLGRVVEHLAHAGIDQFLDLGSGLPAQNPTHVVARTIRPDARVVYVDNDPLAVAHSRAMLGGATAGAAVVQADLRNPRAVLDHPETRRVLDLERPVGLLMVAVLHFVRDADDPYGLVDAFIDALAPGSYVAISHVESDTHPGRARLLEQVYATSSAPGQTRSRAQIEGFFAGLDLVEPGVCHVADWHHRPGDDRWWPDEAWVLGGLARIPSRDDDPRT